MIETLLALWGYAPVLIPVLFVVASVKGFLHTLGRISTEVGQGRIREGLKWAALGLGFGLLMYFSATMALRNGMDVF